MFQGNFLDLLAEIARRFLFHRFLLELQLILLINPYLVLISLHVLLGLVETNIKLVPEVVEDALRREIDPCPLLVLY